MRRLPTRTHLVYTLEVCPRALRILAEGGFLTSAAPAHPGHTHAGCSFPTTELAPGLRATALWAGAAPAHPGPARDRRYFPTTELTPGFRATALWAGVVPAYPEPACGN